MVSRDPCSALPLVALALLVLPRGAAAQTIKLNGALAQPLSGDVVDYRISPDGDHVAFIADQEHNDVFELFAAPSGGAGAPVRLHAPLSPASQGDVQACEIGAGGRAVYRADLVVNNAFELYSAPLTGTASPTVLSGTLVAGGSVESFRLTPDGTRAVFLADKLVNGRPELFSVPVDGSSASLRLDPLDREATEVYRISPDGSFVVFATREFFVPELLHRVPIDASAPPLQIADSGPVTGTDTWFEDLELAADGVHAAFVRIDATLDLQRGDRRDADVFGLALDGSHPPTQLQLTTLPFAVPPYASVESRVVYTEPKGELYTIEGDGSGRVLLGTNAGAFAIAPDETRVVFLAGASPESTLFIAPVDGSSPPLALAGPGTLEQPAFTHDSAFVLYIETDATTSFRGLYALPASGGAPVLLNGPPLVDERGVEDFAVSPVGIDVVYREDRATDEVFELWTVGADLFPRRLSEPLGGFRDVVSYRIGPGGFGVAYLADQFVDASHELFGATLGAGDPPVRYNAPLPGGPVTGDVLDFLATLDGTRVVYRATQETSLEHLYGARTDGNGPKFRLSPPIDAGRALDDYLLTPSGGRVIGLFASFESGAYDHDKLFCSPVSGAGPITVLDVSPDGFGFPFSVAPDESFVVYRKVNENGRYGLYRSALDGSEPIVTYFDLDLRNVTQGEVTPDGLWVVYIANPEGASSQFQLYRVPSDGSAPATLISPPLPDGYVQSFRITPDSARVVYRAPESFNRFELFSVPSDGSGPAVKLNLTPPLNGDVEEYVIAPGAVRLVYRADEVVNDQHELYSAPVAGGPRARLTVLTAGRHVEPDFATSSDGAAVFYRADALAAGVLQLFAVPVDGSASPLELGGTPVSGGNVVSFAASPDQSRIVYLADQRIDEVFELFGVSPLGGSEVQLVTLAATADVTAYRIDPTSEYVVYLSNQDDPTVFELFRVPIDGSAPPERISRAMVGGGDVQAGFIPLVNGRVIYRADQDDEIFELFAFLDQDVTRIRRAPYAASPGTIVR